MLGAILVQMPKEKQRNYKEFEHLGFFKRLAARAVSRLGVERIACGEIGLY